MRVSIDLSAIPRNITGVGRYALEIVNALTNKESTTGLDLTCVVRKGDISRMQSLVPGTVLLGVVPDSRAARLAYELLGLGHALDREGVQLHHGVHYTSPGNFHGKVVTTIQDATLLEHPEWHERSKVIFFRNAMARSAKRADALIFPSEATRTGFLRHFDPKGQTEIIAYGVDPGRFANSLNDHETLSQLGVDQRYFLFCGTLEPRKNLLRILHAFYLMDPKDIILVVVGMKGWGDQALADEKARALIDQGKVAVLGYVDDQVLGALYRNCIATLYPSLEEGFGFPALEAISQGAVLITSQASAMTEYVGDAALLVDPLSLDAIAQAMNVAIYDNVRTSNLRERGPLIASNYTWDASAVKHANLYRRILGT